MHNITKTSGLIKRYVAKSLSDSLLNGAVTSLPSSAAGSDGTDYLRPVVTGSGATYKKTDGMAYLSFNGTDQRMFIPAFTQADPFTMAIVYRLRSTGTLKTIASLNNSTPVTATQLARAADGSITFDGLTRDAPYSGTGWRVGFLASNGANSIVGLDGAYITGTMAGTDVGGLRIGEGVGTFSDIDVAEVLLWNTALTADEIRVLRNDLAAGHPGLF